MLTKIHQYSGPVALITFINETLAENQTRQDEGKEPFGMRVEISEYVWDAYDTLGTYDILSFHNNLNIEVCMLTVGGYLDLVILAGAQPGFAKVSKHSAIRPEAVYGFAWGTYKDIKIKEEELLELNERVLSIVTSSFNITRARIDEALRDKLLITYEELRTMGLSPLYPEEGDRL